MCGRVKGLTEQNTPPCLLRPMYKLWLSLQLLSLWLCSCLQRSWVSTRWSPVIRRTMGPVVKTVTTVSTIIDLNSCEFQSPKKHRSPDACVSSRRDQRGEDEPGVWRAAQSHQRRRHPAEDKEQRQLPHRGQPQQHQGTSTHTRCHSVFMLFYLWLMAAFLYWLFRTFPFPPWRTWPKPWRGTLTSRSSAWQQHGVTTRLLWWEWCGPPPGFK